MGASAAIDYADVTNETYHGRQCAFAPRIPGRERYLAALDAAVAASLSGELSPQEALDRAAEQWSDITEELGVDVQHDAYRKSLGVR